MRRILSGILGHPANTNRRTRPNIRALRLESLEKREVLAASATLNAGVLRVTGDSANDNITIVTTLLLDRGPSLTPLASITLPIKTSLTVKDHTRSTDNTFTFDRALVSRIEVDLGAGNDTFTSDASAPTSVVAGAGNDVVTTGSGNDVLGGGAGNDFLDGGAGNDLVHGGDGDDRIFGSAGDDRLDGNAGNDAVGVSPFGDEPPGNDQIRGGARDEPGNDQIRGGAGNDVVGGGSGNDLVHGDDGDDRVFGSAGDDTLDGGAGNDTVGASPFGDEPGNDVLRGGSGNNTLGGGSGNDTLVSTSRLDIVDGGLNEDGLTVLAGTRTVINGENVRIVVPNDQPQNDGWSGGPNSGSRLLRAYGIDVPYTTLRSKTSENSLISKFRLGTLPSTLREMLGRYKLNVVLEKESNLERVLEVLGSGRPVIALVAVDTKSLSFGGRFGLLRYVVLNGFDQASQRISYVDTDGRQKSWSYGEFDNNWKWFNHFGGVLGEAMQKGLELLGLRKRTILF